MKRYALALAVSALALSFGSAPAWATELPQAPPGGQEIEQSIGAVQLQNTNASPAVAVNTPVNANAPVSVLSHGGGGDATQKNEVEAETETKQGGGSGEQEIEQSIGAVQLQNTNVSPAVAANAPINANAPISLLSKGGGGDAKQKNKVEAETETRQVGCGCGASSSQSRTYSKRSGDQEVERSIGAVQLQGTNVSPAAAGNAPVNANAPVSVLSKGGGGDATQKNEVEAETQTWQGTCGCAFGGQEIERSIAAVQAQNTNLSPAVAANAPVNANAPVSILSKNGGGDATQKNDVEAATRLAAVQTSGMLPFTGFSLVWAVLAWLLLASGATALSALRSRPT
jgi:hypothetical protein